MQTPLHSVRVPTEIWTAALRRARAEGRTVTDVINQALRRYLDKQLQSPSRGEE